MLQKLTDTELDALDQKMENPDDVVYCPRCGRELEFRSVGNSCEVKCPTEDCIKETVRGL